MRPLGVLCVSVMPLVVLAGCSTQGINALAKVPFVDRTEKEVNDWFLNRSIVDDKPFTSNTAINGDPKVLLVNGPGLKVNGTKYPAVLCITQRNTIPGQTLLYAAKVGIKTLNNPNLFECGQIDMGSQSCDGDPMAANQAFLGVRPLPNLEKAFRNHVNQWLKDDIVKTLKSTTNNDGLANSAAQPRSPAKVRGSFYRFTHDKGPPVVRSIGFVAE